MPNQEPLLEIKDILFDEEGNVNLEALISRGLELREEQDASHWEFGDIAIFITDHVGVKELTNYSKAIGVPIKRMRRYRDVAKKYNPGERKQFKVLSWTHFRTAAAYDDRLDLLELAIEREWSVEKLSVYIKERDHGADPDDMDNMKPNTPEIAVCEVCNKWYVIDPNERCNNHGTCLERAS